MIKVDKAMLRDMPHITTLEIKSQEFPIQPEDIKDIIGDIDREIYVAVLGKSIVGMCVVRFNRFEKGSREALIERISTHPNFRRVGVSKAVLTKLVAVAWADGANCIRIRVPEYKVSPGDPDDIEQWLWKAGFKSGKMFRDWYVRYGRKYDAYEFTRVL
jgi:GNAT superfamily N-acetyltransferase